MIHQVIVPLEGPLLAASSVSNQLSIWQHTCNNPRKSILPVQYGTNASTYQGARGENCICAQLVGAASQTLKPQHCQVCAARAGARTTVPVGFPRISIISR